MPEPAPDDLKGEIEHERGRFASAFDAHRQAIDVFRDTEVSAKGPVEALLAYEAYGDTLTEWATRQGRRDAAEQARAAYQTAHDGYTRLNEAGQLPEALTGQRERVAQKLASVATPR